MLCSLFNKSFSCPIQRSQIIIVIFLTLKEVIIKASDRNKKTSSFAIAENVGDFCFPWTRNLFSSEIGILKPEKKVIAICLAILIIVLVDAAIFDS